jgi:hypothetical protein
LLKNRSLGQLQAFAIGYFTKGSTFRHPTPKSSIVHLAKGKGVSVPPYEVRDLAVGSDRSRMPLRGMMPPVMLR